MKKLMLAGMLLEIAVSPAWRIGLVCSRVRQRHRKLYDLRLRCRTGYVGKHQSAVPLTRGQGS